MSNLSSYQATGSYTMPIGSVALVYHTPAVGPDSLDGGNLLRAGSIALQSSYPELYAQVGRINAGTFTPRTSGAGSNAIRALLYANGLYVLAGNTGTLRYSTDAVTWTSVGGTVLSIGLCLAYGSATYVCAGSGGVVTSADGMNSWTLRTSGTSNQINGLAFGNGVFVRGGSGGDVGTSTDGITWTARTSGTTSQINAVLFGNGIFVYAGAGGLLATSTDGITWTARTSGTASTINALIYANGLYVYGADGAGLATSTDAITWTQRQAISGGNAIYALAYGNGRFYAASSALGNMTSTDGVTWSYVIIGQNYIAYAACYGLQFVTAGASGALSTSTDAATLAYTANYNLSTEFQVPPLTVGTVSTGVFQNVYIRAK